MSDTFGMPGPGGSLGTCAFCGVPFLKEILMGGKVPSFTIDGIRQTLYAHPACLKALQRIKEFKDLPPGPLREAWERTQTETV